MSLTGLAFLVAYVGCLGAALSGRFMYGVYAYLGVFYLHPPSRWWGADLPGIRWSLVAAVVMAVSVIASKELPKGKEFFSSVPAVSGMLFTVWLWLQMGWALSTEEQLFVAVLFTKFILLGWILYRVLHTTANIRMFLVANVIGGSYLGYLALVAPSGGRLEGVGGPGLDEANALGMHLGVIAMMLAALLMTERGKWWWAALAGAPLIANGLVQTSSRGALLAVVAGGLVLWILRPSGKNTLFYTFAGLAVAGFLYVAGAQYWERMSTLKAVGREDQELEASAASRIVIAEAQLRMSAARPLGAGYRSTTYLSPIYMPVHVLTAKGSSSGVAMRASHNTLLTVLVEVGWFGFALALVILTWTTRTLLRLKSCDSAGLSYELGWYRAATGGALTVIFVAGLFRDYMTAESYIWGLTLVLALVRLAKLESPDGARGKSAKARRIIGGPSTEHVSST